MEKKTTLKTANMKQNHITTTQRPAATRTQEISLTWTQEVTKPL